MTQYDYSLELELSMSVLSIPPTPALSQEIRIYGDIRILKKGA